MEGNKVELFLDSGAYSAFSKGITIDIQEYIKFINENRDYVQVYANLDVIGDAEGTLKNQKIMEDAGLDPIPCFHYGEDWKYLKYYVDNYEYIALGGVAQAGRDMATLIKWMDICFADYICDDHGFPKVKVHGFAVTSLRLMLRYPWYSVDSTSWVLTGRYGAIYVPRYRDGRYIYNENTWKVKVSTRITGDSFEEGKHILTFSQMEREQILAYFHFKGYSLGKSEFRQEVKGYKLKEGERWAGKNESDGQRGSRPERGGFVIRGFSQDWIVETIIEAGVSNDYHLRDEMNIIYFLDLEKNMPEWPWAFKGRITRGFFQ